MGGGRGWAIAGAHQPATSPCNVPASRVRAAVAVLQPQRAHGACMVITARSAPARRPSDGAPPRGPTGVDIDPLRPARSVAHGGYTVLVCRPDGSIDGMDTGLYDLDTRVLSRYVLRLDGAPPASIGSCAAMADEWASTLHLRRPGGSPEGPALPQDAWAVHITRRIGCGMAETITIRNESMEPARARLTIDLDADFSDVLRAPIGSPKPEIQVEWVAETARLEWLGTYRHEGRQDQRGLAVTVDPPPADVEQGDEGAPHGRRLSFDIDLEGRGESTIQLTFASLADGAWRQPADATSRWSRRAHA